MDKVKDMSSFDNLWLTEDKKSNALMQKGMKAIKEDMRLNNTDTQRENRRQDLRRVLFGGRNPVCRPARRKGHTPPC